MSSVAAAKQASKAHGFAQRGRSAETAPLESSGAGVPLLLQRASETNEAEGAGRAPSPESTMPALLLARAAPERAAPVGKATAVMHALAGSENSGAEHEAQGEEEAPQSPVQSRCAECTEASSSGASGQCVECAGGSEAAPVQMWDCTDYPAPTCVQPKPAESDELLQEKCASCEGDRESTVQNADATPKRGGPAGVQRAAKEGLSNATGLLPHGDRIQAAFGRHDVSGVRTGVGGAAGHASEQMGALAFTSGDRIGFRRSPDLHLAAHEAAHVVQQRAGLKLPGNVGRRGDPYERHADRVADAVVAGRSAEPLLDQVAGGSSGQRAPAEPVQRAITSGASREVEAPLRGAPTSAGGGAAAAAGDGAAADGDSAPATSETDAPSPEETPAEEQSSPDEACASAEESGPAEQAPGERPTEAASEEESSAGAELGACFDEDTEPPPDDAPEPEQDSPPNDVEEESEVTFPEWEEPNDACECEVGEQLALVAGQVPAEVTAEDGAESGELLEQAQGRQGEGAAESAAAGGAAASGGGAPAEGGEASEASSEAAGSLAGRESARDAAVTDYQSASFELVPMPARARSLSEGLSFGGEPPQSGTEAAGQANALAEIRGFLLRAAGQIEDAVAFVQSEVPARLGAMADATKAGIGAAIESEKSTVSARIAAARAMAIDSAAAARARVLATYEASVATVHAETDAALSALEAEYAMSTEAIAVEEETALDEVSQRFADGRRDHDAKGTEYGDLAIARGQEHVDAYEKCKVVDGEKYGDDGFWDGCLSVRRAHAQQNAACKTAAGFYENMVETAQQKGFDLREQRTQYRCAVISGAGQSQSTLDTTIEQLTGGLESGRAGTLQGLRTARDMNLSGIDAALTGTLAGLDRQEQDQLQAINDSGYVQQVAVEELAHTAAASLARGVGSAMDSLEQTLGGLREQLTSGVAPEPEALAELLAAAEAGLGGGVGTLLDKMQEGTAAAEAQLVEAGAGALDSLRGIADQNDALSAEAEARFSDQLASLVISADGAMTTLTAKQVQKAQSTAAEGVASMKKLVDGFKEATTTIYTKVDEAIATSLSELEQDLEHMLEKLDGKIASEAWKAAEKEQPAWKGVLAIVLIILVVIASVVVSVLTLGAGAPFLAVVLVGAIVGAISAGLIQIINNWAAGEEWDEGLVQAMVIGAVGGALGGAIGGGANALAQAAIQGAARAGAGLAARTAINVGLNLAGDLVAEGATQTFAYVAYGRSFNWQGFVMAGGMSVASTARAGGAPGARPRGADVNAPAPAPVPRTGARSAREALGDVAIGVGLAAGVEAVGAAAGGDFDFTRFASSAAAGSAGARAAARGARGGRPPAEPPPTTRLGRASAAVGRARDRAFGGIDAFQGAVGRGARSLVGRGRTVEAGAAREPEAAPETVPTRSPSERGTDVGAHDSRVVPKAEEPDAIPGAHRDVRIAGAQHRIAAKQGANGEVVLTSCSNCATLRNRLQNLADDLPAGAARERAQELRDEAQSLQDRINRLEPIDIAAETRALAERVEHAAAEHPELAWGLRNLLEGVSSPRIDPSVRPRAPAPGGWIDAPTRQEFQQRTGGTARGGWFEPENAFSPTARRSPDLNEDAAWKVYESARRGSATPALGEFGSVRKAVAANKLAREEAIRRGDTPPPELEALGLPKSVWQNQVNDAWLAGHIERGAEFRIVSNPTAGSLLETRLGRGGGDRIQSVFGRELVVLERQGYRFVQDQVRQAESTRGITGRMVPPSELANLAAQGYTWIPHSTPIGQFEGVSGRWVKLPPRRHP